MHEGWCAFCIAILENCTPEQAFSRLEGKTVRNRLKIDNDDVADIVRLREVNKLTYREISEIYNISKYAISYRIKRYKAKLAG
jgi:DNA-directed RNA polymerase specialized sigma24 family protein